jgi:hypothetical protein
LIADIIGLQESVVNQFKDLKAALPDYEAIGAGRDDGKLHGEMVPIFFNKNRFSVCL